MLTSQNQAQAIAENRNGVRGVIAGGWASFSRTAGNDAANALMAEANHYVSSSQYRSSLPAGEERQAAVEFHALRMAQERGMEGATVPFTQSFAGMAGQNAGGLAGVTPSGLNMAVEGPAADTEQRALAGKQGAEGALGVPGAANAGLAGAKVTSSSYDSTAATVDFVMGMTPVENHAIAAQTHQQKEAKEVKARVEGKVLAPRMPKV